jgi:hypothetical protein
MIRTIGVEVALLWALALPASAQRVIQSTQPWSLNGLDGTSGRILWTLDRYGPAPMARWS